MGGWAMTNFGVPPYRVARAVDEFSNERFFVEDANADWLGPPHDSKEAASEAADELAAGFRAATERVLTYVRELAEVHPGGSTPTAEEVRTALDTAADPIALATVELVLEESCCFECGGVLEAPEASCSRAGCSYAVRP